MGEFSRSITKENFMPQGDTRPVKYYNMHKVTHAM